jgi:hypothetical protein
MFNLNAPIIPGESAAGVRLGQPINGIISTVQPRAMISLHGSVKLHFESVTLWVKGKHVTQIGVASNYRGKIGGTIGIGSTIRDVQNTLGQVIEDEEDNLTVAGMAGWYFETEPWRESHELESNLDARVTEIFVHA